MLLALELLLVGELAAGLDARGPARCECDRIGADGSAAVDGLPAARPPAPPLRARALAICRPETKPSR